MKRGISLIVLVITIIVMIVLAGTIILSLNNAGIIENSNEAVKSTNEATVKELAQMVWAEAYVDGIRTVEDEGNKKGLKTIVIDSLKANKIDVTKYFLNVTTKGVTVKLLDEAWVQEGLKVKRGADELDIGQTIKYNATGTDYEGKEWKVLGADEDGNLLIMSATDVVSAYKFKPKNLSEAQSDWLSGGVKKINSVCSTYAKGEGAISGRSITIEDIDKLTQYDKTKYGVDTIAAYGNIVTYLYTGDEYPKYLGANEQTGEITLKHDKGFHWYDENGFCKVEIVDLMNTQNIGKEIATITNTYYGYAGTHGKKLTMNMDAYKMLFGTSDSYAYYWLASSFVFAGGSMLGYGLRIIKNGCTGVNYLWSSTGNASTPECGVRAVVTISSEVPFPNLLY